MRKIIIFMMSGALLLMGCSSNASTYDPDIQKRFEKEGFKMKYRKDNDQNIDIISFESDDIEIFYNSTDTVGAFHGESFYSPTSNSGFYGGKYACIYDFDEKEAYSCDAGESESIQNLQTLFNKTLENLDISVEQFRQFAKKRMSSYLAEVTAMTNEEKLERLDFKLINHEYVLEFEEIPYDELTPKTLKIDLEKKKMYLIYNESTAVIEWKDAHIVSEEMKDGSVCSYNVNSMKYGEESCSSKQNLRLFDFYDFFNEFQEMYDISL